MMTLLVPPVLKGYICFMMVYGIHYLILDGNPCNCRYPKLYTKWCQLWLMIFIFCAFVAYFRDLEIFAFMMESTLKNPSLAARLIDGAFLAFFGLHLIFPFFFSRGRGVKWK